MYRCSPVVISLLFTACSRHADRPALATPAAAARDRLPTIAPTPFLTIHVPDSIGGASADMGWVVRLSSGRYAAADRDGGRVLVFDSAGNLARVLGRAGSGPGEYRGPSLIQEIPPDSLLVWDPFLRRISWVDTHTGGSRALAIGTDKLYGGAPLAGQLDDGRLVAQHEDWRSERAGEPAHPSITLRLLHQDGTLAHDLFSDLPVHNQDQHGFRFFGPTTWVSTDGHRLAVGTNSEWKIRIYTPDGQLLTTLSRPWRPRPVTEADRKAVRAFCQAQGASCRPGSPEDSRFDATVPAFSLTLFSQDGTIWVLGYSAPNRWADSVSVFNAEGRYLGSLRLPDELRPTAVGADYILGKATTPDGDFEIRVYALDWVSSNQQSQ